MSYYNRLHTKGKTMLKVIDSTTIQMQEVRIRDYKMARSLSDIMQGVEIRNSFSPMHNVDKSKYKNDSWIKDYRSSKYGDSFYYDDITSFDKYQMEKLEEFISDWNKQYGLNMSIFTREYNPGDRMVHIVYPDNRVQIKLIPQEVVDDLELSTTDINEMYLKDKNIFINHYIDFYIMISYDENEKGDYERYNNLQVFPSNSKILTFDIGNLPDINLLPNESLQLGRKYFKDVADRLQDHHEIPEKGSLTTAGYLDKNTNMITLYLLEATNVQYDTVYAFFVGRGEDGGFGDYTTPTFTHPYIDNGRVVYVKTADEAAEVEKHLNNIWSDRFYDSGRGGQYSGDFPLEINIIPLTIPKEFSSNTMTSQEVIEIMDNVDSFEHFS